MTADIPVPPRTIMEVYKMLPEGTLAELINGKIYMSPAPNNQHQRVLIKLFKVISSFVEEYQLGEVFISPSDLYLDKNINAVQPDLYVVSYQNPMIILEDKPNYGVPELIIEVLSPGNNQHDLVIKKNLYEQFGVSEYWIVNPSTQDVLLFTLNNGKFELKEATQSSVNSSLFNHTFHF